LDIAFNMLTLTRQLDESTLESLFKDYFIGLCQFAVGYVKDHEVAKEIVQDAFVSLWEKRQTIDLSKPVKSYLSATVRNRCLNYLRDHKKFSNDLLALENLSNETIYDQPINSLNPIFAFRSPLPLKNYPKSAGRSSN